jgi:hypothetical protein
MEIQTIHFGRCGPDTDSWVPGMVRLWYDCGSIVVRLWYEGAVYTYALPPILCPIHYPILYNRTENRCSVRHEHQASARIIVLQLIFPLISCCHVR